MYLPHSNIEIKLRDASFAEADLGAMTWGASRLFAKMMDNPPDELVPYLEACRDKDILELGTGTGLAGISLAACLSQRQQSPQSITLTDYHDGVLQNAKMNVEANIDESVQQRVRLAKLDWKRLASDDTAAVTDESTNSVFPELDGDSKFDVIIGADVVYSLEMATLVPRVINHHLASRHSSGNLCPFALIILPKRDRHDADIDSFEQTMLQVGFICELMLELTVDGELASNEHREEGTLLYRCYIYKHNIKQT
ncbi:hypothetical protein GQ42DRAFT_153797 [Ramicandelaber brevisporus]|nr:hypothetical protein GQ42DRAFT_153797 [Ramicandelaber brevisporus]